MQISIKPELQHFIEKEVRERLFGSADEVAEPVSTPVARGPG